MTDNEERKKCARCKVNILVSEFKERRNGELNKSCNRCLEVKKAWKANHPETKCEHGKQKHICKECKGSSICEHQRRKNECRFCAGDSFEDALFGCVKINESKKSVVFQYYETGKRFEKLFRYVRCGLNEALEKAENARLEFSNNKKAEMIN